MDSTRLINLLNENSTTRSLAIRISSRLPGISSRLWCIVNSSKGVEQIPTSRPPIDSDQVSKLLEAARRSPSIKGINALKKLRSLVQESEGNRRCIAESSSSLVLASLFNSSCCQEKDNEKFGALEETLGILHLLPITQETAKSLSEAACIRSIALILHRGTSEWARVLRGPSKGCPSPWSPL